jgi:hypothetical protein
MSPLRSKGHIDYYNFHADFVLMGCCFKQKSLPERSKIVPSLKVSITFSLALVSLIMAGASWAQPGPGARGGGMHYGTMWDANSVTTIAGEVTAVEKYTPGKGGTAYGMRLTVKTDQGTLPVILGPGWYIEQQHFAITPKDTVEVKGSRLSIQGQPMVIAAEVKRGGQTLTLRDDKGIPLWIGPR